MSNIDFMALCFWVYGVRDGPIMGGGVTKFYVCYDIRAGVRNFYIRLIRGVAKYTRQILSILQGGHGLSGPRRLLVPLRRLCKEGGSPLPAPIRIWSSASHSLNYCP